MNRKESHAEARAARRAVLDALPSAMSSVGLQACMPKLCWNPERSSLARYANPVSMTRRSDGTTVQETIMSRILLKVNEARSAAARRQGLEPLAELQMPAFAFIKNVILPMGKLVGLEDVAAFRRLMVGRNNEQAIERLLDMKEPFVDDSDENESLLEQLASPPEKGALGDSRPTSSPCLATQRPPRSPRVLWSQMPPSMPQMPPAPTVQLYCM
jgi:hypothetical protein